MLAHRLLFRSAAQMADPSAFALQTLGIVHSDFDARFGIPRQSGLAPSAQGELVMLPPFDDPRLFEGLESFSHLWLTFVFHTCLDQGWRGRVRPPRLGGNRRLGVFATRSPFRPNHLGLSAVRLEGIEIQSGLRLRLSGLDLLHGTPVVDIRPYVHYADALPNARGGFAAQRPELLPVDFLPAAECVLAGVAPRLRRLIAEVLGLDPRPAYQDEGRDYGMRLAGLEIRWRVRDGRVEVLEINSTTAPFDAGIE
jgi:tRNA-Thr(GGU) m(6)t(6)A37 methyltransferase TsaA